MGDISVKTGFSGNKNEEMAVREVFEKIKQDGAKIIIAFIDSRYDQQKINKAWRELISPPTLFIGSATLRSDVPSFRIEENVISSEGFKSGLAAISISSDKIDASVRLMRNIGESWEEESSRAIKEAAQEIGLDLKKADPEKHFGILMCDTVSTREDDILENLYGTSNLNFIGGGSVGKMNLGTWIFKGGVTPGHVHTKDGVFSDAAVLALVKCDLPFKIDLITNFSPTEHKFVVTKAEGLFIHELNGRPAVEEYIKAVGIPRKKLWVERVPNMSVFSEYVLGLMINNRAYIRLIGTRRGNSLRMASPVKEGQTIYLMKKEDIIKTTADKMNNLKEDLGPISAMVLFHCGMRMLEAKKMKKLDELFETMNIAPMVGGCTFREYYGWLAMECSLGILAIGK